MVSVTIIAKIRVKSDAFTVKLFLFIAFVCKICNALFSTFLEAKSNNVKLDSRNL